MKSGCEKFDLFPFETSKNKLTRTSRRNGRLRINMWLQEYLVTCYILKILSYFISIYHVSDYIQKH